MTIATTIKQNYTEYRRHTWQEIAQYLSTKWNLTLDELRVAVKQSEWSQFLNEYECRDCDSEEMHFIGCPCEGDPNKCPRPISHAVLASRPIFEGTVLTGFTHGAYTCKKWKSIADAEEAERRSAERIKKYGATPAHNRGLDD